MPRTEEQIQELVREMYTTGESADWDLSPETVRSQSGQRGLPLPDVKVLVLVAAAVILIVVGIVVTKGSTSHSTTAGEPGSTTTPSNQQTVVAPDLVGLTQAAAQYSLGRAGLHLGNVTLATSGQYAAGVVVGQMPAAGSSVGSGGTVHVVISTGPSGTSGTTQPAPTTSTTGPVTGSVLVPSLIGLSQDQAGNALGQAGLNIGSVGSATSTQFAAGIVISESPAPGSSVVPGSSVEIVVSTGP